MERISQVVIVSLSHISSTDLFKCHLRIGDLEYDTEFYYDTVGGVKGLKDTSGVMLLLERHNLLAFRVINDTIDKLVHGQDVHFPIVVPV